MTHFEHVIGMCLTSSISKVGLSPWRRAYFHICVCSSSFTARRPNREDKYNPRTVFQMERNPAKHTLQTKNVWEHLLDECWNILDPLWVPFVFVRFRWDFPESEYP